MSIPGDASPLLLGGGAQQYKIERSLRFNSSDSAYLSRTPASAGNRKTWTWSGWLKRLGIGGTDETSVFQARVSNTQIAGIVINPGGNIFFQDYNLSSSYNTTWTTNAVYRDPSAWYHLVVVCDFTQASSGNAIRIYVNGVEQALTFSLNGGGPYTQNRDTYINSTIQHSIGLREDVKYLNAYLADIHFIDGQALDPTSFAETNITTGQWVPKAYTGTYGTNGFRLAFADNSNNTATTLGKDSSGNGNNWTPNNLSVTAGAGNDSLVETPTSYGTDTGAGGEARGNYCTLNPLDNAGLTLSNGNLDFQNSSAAARNVRSTVALPSSGKYYAECVFTSATASATYVQFGLLSSTDSLTSNLTFCIEANQAISILARTPSASPVLRSSTVVAGDIFQVAVDIDNSKIWFGINNTWYNSSGGTNGNPATGANATGTLAASTTYFFAIGKFNTAGSQSVNFGQRSWAYAAPAGFKALCDTNLPAPVVAKPNTVFDVKLYTGNGSSQTISGLGFSPDLVWLKDRNAGNYHNILDTIRGGNARLSSNVTDAENTGSAGGATPLISTFNSDGFTFPNGNLNTNATSTTYVAWTWDAGSSTVTNTQGSITSQVRANASAGFSVVTYTGNNNNGSATVGHGLGVAPQFIIAKKRSGAGNWMVGHKATTQPSNLRLNTTDQLITSFVTNAIGSSSSSTFLVYSYNNGVLADNLNDSGATYVAYCFAPVAGYSSFGSYTGNGSTDGPFVYTGFRPRWILLKASSIGGGNYSWRIWDAVRDSYNASVRELFPNLSNSESADGPIDILSNGFKLRDTFEGRNQNATTYIYAAFAENPFQYARAR